jgi:hypothetical protein
MVGGKLGGVLRSGRVVVLWGFKETIVGSSDTDAVTPVGASSPSSRAFGVHLLHSLPSTERNPKTSLGKNVTVVIAFILEGVSFVRVGSEC